MSMKHAYLIIAHNNWHQLGTLLSLIDDERNDIFVHIDARAGRFPQKELEEHVRKSTITFIPRKKVYWADYSVADVEMDLMQAASDNDSYHYYHLLSGMCLLLKTQDELHDFFENETHEFIAMTPDGGGYVEKHSRYYHPFVGTEIYRKCKPLKALDRGIMYVQRILGLKRRHGRELTISTGWQWFSITDEFCRYVLSQRSYIFEMFKVTLDVDEKFIGTMVNKLGCHDRLYRMTQPGEGNDTFMQGCQRLIEFDRGLPQPYVWGSKTPEADYQELTTCGFLFARKFDENVNAEIIDRLVEWLHEKESRAAQGPIPE